MTCLTLGRIAEWIKAADCKSAGSTFGGSNPSSPTGINFLLGYGLTGRAADFDSVSGGSNPSILIFFYKISFKKRGSFFTRKSYFAVQYRETWKGA